MAIIPRVKCSRCDRIYSGLQSKCPYCGARRSQKGRFAVPESGDAKWRLAVGVILLMAIVFTVIGLIRLGGSGNTQTPKDKVEDVSPSPSTSDTSKSSPEPSASASPSPSPSPTMESITAISVQWAYFSGTHEMTINVGDSIPLEAVITPSTANVKVTWSSEDETVCKVDSSGNLTAISSGKVDITAEYNGVKGLLTVRVN